MTGAVMVVTVDDRRRRNDDRCSTSRGGDAYRGNDCCS